MLCASSALCLQPAQAQAQIAPQATGQLPMDVASGLSSGSAPASVGGRNAVRTGGGTLSALSDKPAQAPAQTPVQLSTTVETKVENRTTNVYGGRAAAEVSTAESAAPTPADGSNRRGAAAANTKALAGFELDRKSVV